MFEAAGAAGTESHQPTARFGAATYAGDMGDKPFVSVGAVAGTALGLILAVLAADAYLVVLGALLGIAVAALWPDSDTSGRP